MKNFLVSLLVVILAVVRHDAYQPTFFRTVRSTSLLTMKRGRGSFQREAGMGKPAKSLGGESEESTKSLNWIPLPKENKLPQQENEIIPLDTNLVTLKNAATNPTGAVAVAKYDEQYYCFSVACPSCKIPLTKAKIVPANEESGKAPRLVCDFCKATYNVKTGEKLQAAESGGLFGGVVKSIFASKDSGTLPTYKLGEKNGQLLISFD